MIQRQPIHDDAVSNQHRLLELLADGRFHSGQDLGQTLSITRSAIWKLLRSLSARGLPVVAVKGKGYCLEQPLEFLSRECLLSHIDAGIIDAITNLTVLTEVNSTNQFLLDRIGQPDFHAHVVLAEYQSAGRGRRGNDWLSPFGSGISLSIGWDFIRPPAALGVISLVLGVAVIDALKYFGIKTAGLKWPNDILHKQKKLGGILVEMRGELAGNCQLVMGIGLNYSLPQGLASSLERPVTDLVSIADSLPTRNEFAARLVSEVIALLTTLDAAAINDLMNRWRQHDCLTGKTVTLQADGAAITGQAMGIDDSGSLLLQIDNQVRTFTSGDISLRSTQ